jgi:hypothetical protein
MLIEFIMDEHLRLMDAGMLQAASGDLCGACHRFLVHCIQSSHHHSRATINEDKQQRTKPSPCSTPNNEEMPHLNLVWTICKVQWNGPGGQCFGWREFSRDTSPCCLSGGIQWNNCSSAGDHPGILLQRHLRMKHQMFPMLNDHTGRRNQLYDEAIRRASEDHK